MPQTDVLHASGDGSAALPALELIQAVLATINAAGPEAQHYSSAYPARVIHVGWYALQAFGVVVWWKYVDFDAENAPIYAQPFYADALQWHLNGGADLSFSVVY